MQLIEEAEVSVAAGIAGDHKGPKLRTRQVTLLALEDWQTALAALDPAIGAVDLDWTARRANLLTEGLVLPAAFEAILHVGPVRLEVMHPTYPCTRMTEAHPDLMRALAADWRGGVSARVLTGGTIRIGNAITIEAPGRPWTRPKLP